VRAWRARNEITPAPPNIPLTRMSLSEAHYTS